jgi:hypothetical protein
MFAFSGFYAYIGLTDAVALGSWVPNGGPSLRRVCHLLGSTTTVALNINNSSTLARSSPARVSSHLATMILAVGSEGGERSSASHKGLFDDFRRGRDSFAILRPSNFFTLKGSREVNVHEPVPLPHSTERL